MNKNFYKISLFLCMTFSDIFAGPLQRKKDRALSLFHNKIRDFEKKDTITKDDADEFRNAIYEFMDRSYTPGEQAQIVNKFNEDFNREYAPECGCFGCVPWCTVNSITALVVYDFAYFHGKDTMLKFSRTIVENKKNKNKCKQE